MHNLFSALKAGNELSNAEAWKDIQVITNAITVIGVSVSSASGLDIPDTLSKAVGAVLWGAFNIYLTYATSKRVGM